MAVKSSELRVGYACVEFTPPSRALAGGTVA